MIFLQGLVQEAGWNKCKAEISKIKKKGKKNSSVRDNEIWAIKLYLMSYEGRSETVLGVSVGSEERGAAGAKNKSTD